MKNLNSHTITSEPVPAHDYPVLISDGLLMRAGELLREHSFGGRAAIITDDTVGALYCDMLQKSLRDCGYQSEVFSFPAGERSKTLRIVEELCNRMESFARGDFVIALGGGVAGDLGGFVAATYLRGLPLVQMPTTLLAQVDSAIGGKCGVNLAGGKNLLGAFYNPRLVIIDPLLLQTLPEREYSNGMAEVIKYALVALPELWGLLERGEVPEKEKMIADCCAAKLALAEADPYDHGVRKILNFGHTLGHCYEVMDAYCGVKHGEAVAAGMVQALLAGERLGVTQSGLTERLIAVLEKYKLPTRFVANDKGKLRKLLQKDKKQSESGLQVVLLEKLGKPLLRILTAEELIG